MDADRFLLIEVSMDYWARVLTAEVVRYLQIETLADRLDPVEVDRAIALCLASA